MYAGLSLHSESSETETRQPTQNVEYTLHSSFSPLPQRRGHQTTSVSVHYRSSGAAVTAQLSFVLMRLQGSSFHQCSKTGEKEISPTASFLKIWNIGQMLQYFPFPGRYLELGVFFHLFHAELRGGIMTSESHKFFYILDPASFKLAWGTDNLKWFFFFLISHKWNWSRYCWLNVFFGGKMV